MTVAYTFRCVYTKAGIATTPTVAPVLTVQDTAGNKLVDGAAVTALTTNIAGCYFYSYVGAAGLNLIGLFHTTDATMDQQDIIADSDIVQNLVETNLDAQISTNSAALTKLINALVPLSGSVNDVSATATVFKTTLTALADANFVKGMSMVFYGTSTLAGQARQIKAYVIANGVMTMQGLGFTHAPTNGDTFYICSTAVAAILADFLSNLGTDFKSLISTDVQDLSTTLSVNAKLLNGATPNDPSAATVADAVRDEVALKAVSPIAGSIGKLISDNLNAPVGSIPTSNPSASTIADAVRDEVALKVSNPVVGSIGKLISDNLNAPVGSIPTNPYTGTPPTSAAIADAVRDEVALKPSNPVTGSIGKLISDNLNAPVGSIPTNPSIAGDKMDLVDSLKNKVGSSGYDRTQDSLEALGSKVSGLTAQETRDAMKLAPTTGAPASGSIDALVSAIPTNPLLANSTLLPATVIAAKSDLPASAPSVTDIDTQLSHTHGSGDWGLGGTGSNTVPVYTTVSGHAKDGVSVWVTSDSDGSTTVQTGISDDHGLVTFYLDDGDFWVWRQLSGFTWTNPEKIKIPDDL